MDEADSAAVAVASVAAIAVVIGVGVVAMHHTKRVARYFESTLPPSIQRASTAHSHWQSSASAAETEKKKNATNWFSRGF